MRIAIVEDGIVTNIIEAPMIYADNQKQAYDWIQLHEAYTDVEPLEYAKLRYKTAAKAYRDAQEVAVITYNGNDYDYDAKARERLLIARTAIEDAGGAGTIEWTLADNTRVPIGLDDFKGINATAAQRSDTLHDNYTTLKTALSAATTVEQLEEIYPLGGE